MARTNIRLRARLRRKERIRKRIRGSEETPRLTVFRSTKHIYAQIINDVEGVTVVAASSLKLDEKGNVEQAAAVGKALGEAAKSAGIGRVRFDRNGYRYHGRVKALADAARESGLEF